LSVSDTGRGIPEEDLPYVFDRYHVVDSSILHTGAGFRLGLPISKMIVERHGGRIWAESRMGKGSTFNIFLPSQRRIQTDEWLNDASM
ncbi:MAG: sensor histidine kinase, partial [Thermoplasmata archaeon]|nr:sensor histidine kinase [Candidatus Sysuiplasma superficiale]